MTGNLRTAQRQGVPLARDARRRTTNRINITHSFGNPAVLGTPWLVLRDSWFAHATRITSLEPRSAVLKDPWLCVPALPRVCLRPVRPWAGPLPSLGEWVYRECQIRNSLQKSIHSLKPT